MSTVTASQAPAAHPIGEIIGSGKVADVHAYGPYAIKLYKSGRPRSDAFLEAAVLSIIEQHDHPAPRVHSVGDFGGRTGLVMDRVKGATLAEQAQGDPAKTAECLNEMVRLQTRLHATAEPRLRPLKARLAANIARTKLLGADEKSRLVADLGALPGGDRICHGDFHPFNIIGAPGKTTIIDWMDATCGPPAADACRSYLLLRGAAPALAEQYLGAYCRGTGVARVDVIAWLPVTAAARLCEDVPEEETALLTLARGG